MGSARAGSNPAAVDIFCRLWCILGLFRCHLCLGPLEFQVRCSSPIRGGYRPFPGATVCVRFPGQVMIYV